MIKELSEKNKENEYIISGKMREKEIQIAGLKEQQLDSAEAIEVLSDRLTKALEDIELLKKSKWVSFLTKSKHAYLHEIIFIMRPYHLILELGVKP